MKIIKWILGLLSISLILIAIVVWFLLDNACESKPIEILPSKNDVLKVVVSTVNCGATTGYSTHVSIINTNEKAVDVKKGNVFIADTDHGEAPSYDHGGPIVKMNWLSDKELEIEHHQKARIFRSEVKVKGVKIIYKINGSS